ncbi:hypothetical protein K7432_018627, partial [Basidiobolus ranarum]
SSACRYLEEGSPPKYPAQSSLLNLLWMEIVLNLLWMEIVRIAQLYPAESLILNLPAESLILNLPASVNGVLVDHHSM